LLLASLEPGRTAEMLRAMFAGPPGSRDGPMIEADTSRNAIVVRGSREQVDEVRSALRALGEPAAPAGRARIITLERGDAATLAEALQKLLPELRNNPVRVIVPGKPEEGPRPP